MKANDSTQEKPRRFYRFGEFSFDAASKILWRGAATVQLAPKACDLLAALVENAPQILSKEALLNRVWADSFVEEANLTHHISALRKALGEDKSGRRFIETIPRKGYRFVAAISETENDVDGGALDEQIEDTESAPEAIQTTAGGNQPAALSAPPNEDFLTPINSADKNLPSIESSEKALPTPIESGVQTTRRALPKPLRFAALALILVGVSGGGYALYKLFARSAPIVFRPGTVKRLTTTGKIAVPVVSADGRYLLYLKREGGERSLWIRQIAADIDVPITPPTPNDDVYGGAAFTPDGNHVYYSLRRKGEPHSVLYRVPVLGGAPVKILENLIAAITFAPDGKQFAFLRTFPEQKESAVMIADADGGGERRLAARPRPAHFNGHPAWSPDGKTILVPAVSLNGGFHYEMLATSVADGSVQPIPSKRWQNVGNAAWLPDASGILLVAQNEDSPATQIWQVSIPGGEARQITADTNIYGSVGLTGDGRFLVANKLEQESHLWIASIEDQADAKQLTQGEDNYDGLGGVAWLPQDGERIVYQSKANGRDAIWQTAANDKSPQRLVDDLGAGFAVSPDGSFVVYQNQETGSQGLWRFNIQDGTAARLTTGVDITPSFTPDGKTILFVRLAEATNLWRVPASGGEAVQITDQYRSTTSPVVSPDGRFIAFAYSRAEKKSDEPQSGLAIMPTEGGAPLKTFPASFQFGGLYEQPTLQWTPDAAGVNYIVLRDGVSNVWRQPTGGGAPVQITNFNDGRIFNFAFAPDGKRVALARGRVVSDVVMIENAR